MKNSNEKYSNYNGWLEKKSHSLISGWQKRYFRILDGQIMLYFGSVEDKQPKGNISFSLCTKAISLESTVFKFSYGDKEILLKASTEALKNEWINAINYFIDYHRQQHINKKQINNAVKVESPSIKKIKSLSKREIALIKKHGFILNNDTQLSERLLESKEISSLLDIKYPNIINRIHYGFLYKKQKNHDVYQKRWFFIFSSRPLSDELYITDDISLEQKKLKKWMKYDHLVYFNYENDSSIEPKACYDLSECHMIETNDRNDIYYITLDVKDHKHEFYSEIKGERELWFEVLKNSRKTAKEIKASISKHPRNIYRLLNMISVDNNNNYNYTRLTTELEKEKKQIIGDYTLINEYDTLNFIIENLEKSICSTIDGCISCNTDSTTPSKFELLKFYIENFDMTYILVIQSFWSSQYNTLDNVHLMKISSLFFDFEIKLKIYNVIDHNITRCGKDFSKIFIRKLFNNIIEVIEHILCSEREIKAVQSSLNPHLITNGPIDLFSVLLKTKDLIKHNKHKYIHVQLLKIFHESIIQYLIGVDCIISNYQLEVDNEFLLAISNNTIDLYDKLQYLISDWELLQVLNRNEINEAICLEKNTKAFNLMNKNALRRLVKSISGQLAALINKNKYYIDMNIEKIMIETCDMFKVFSTKMNLMVEKKFYEELLKLTICYYMRLLLMTGHKKVKKVEEIINKLKNDQDILMESYKNVVGNNLTVIILKIFNDIRDFLDIRVELIGTSCEAIREFIGSSFQLKTVKLLIHLRSDLSSKDKKEGIQICKDIIDNFKDKGKEIGYFDMIINDIHISNEEYNEDYLETKGDNDTEEQEEEEQKQKTVLNTKYFTLEEFLDNDNNNSNKDYQSEDQKDSNSNIEGLIQPEDNVSDIIYEGHMKKKSISLWHERFFQLKNGYLYWFKDKTSNQIEKKVSILSILKINSYKEKRFIMILQEKKEIKDGKVYKFELKTNQEKEDWLNALRGEMKRLKVQTSKCNEILLEIKPKKKFIVDYYHLPDINQIRHDSKNRIIESIKSESFFKHIIKTNSDQIIQKKRNDNLDIDDIAKVPHSSSKCCCTKTVVKNMTGYFSKEKTEVKEYLNQ